ncbi:MAG TPA: hypothetical protein VFF76_05745 [Holophagaceae bacterium]|jgi:hypothetical protein|nr:hypothetical protein [Holophagaceae bacterium]
MRSALKTVAAVIVGFVAASIVMMIVEFLNGHLFYPGLGKAAEGVMDREVLRGLLANAPISAMLVVIAGWVLGGLTGGWVASRVSPQAAMGSGLILGILLTLAGVANNFMIPPPAWFWVASLIVLMPSAYAGARLGSRSTRA